MANQTAQSSKQQAAVTGIVSLFALPIAVWHRGSNTYGTVQQYDRQRLTNEVGEPLRRIVVLQGGQEPEPGLFFFSLSHPHRPDAHEPLSHVKATLDKRRNKS